MDNIESTLVMYVCREQRTRFRMYQLYRILRFDFSLCRDANTRMASSTSLRVCIVGYGRSLRYGIWSRKRFRDIFSKSASSCVVWKKAVDLCCKRFHTSIHVTRCDSAQLVPQAVILKS